MKALEILIILTAILVLAMLYAPQPLAPLMANFFGVSTYKISWVMTLALTPLAIAPIFYGYLLEKFSLKKILVFSLFFCSILQILASLSTNFYIFLSLRTLQALFIPAVLTALLTLLMRIGTNIQRNVALYVGATTFGGFLGRVFGSILADYFSWQIALDFFANLMLLCALAFCLIKNLHSNLDQNVCIKDFYPFFKKNKFKALFFCIFTMFFAFQSVVSFLPFHLNNTFTHISQTHIGLVYLGFLTGVLSSVLIKQTITFFRSNTNTAIFGLIVFIIGCLSMMIKNFYFLFLAMFVFCSGMFICHCIFSALLNLNSSKKALANGLYLTFYYSGGVIGSIVPSLYYETLGWDFLCSFTAILLLGSFCVFLKFKKSFQN